jgi:uncharacterized membrane protein required for colicin V production
MYVLVNLFNIILAATLIVFLVKGRKNGLFLEMVRLGGFFIALVASLNLLPRSAHWVNRIIELAPNMSAITGFALTFAAILLIYQFIVAFIQKNTKVQVEEWLNRLGGLLLGGLKGATVVSLLALMISLFPFAQNVVDAEKDSFVFGWSKNVMPSVYSVVKRVVPGSPHFSKIVDDTFLWFGLSELDDNSKKFLQEYGSDHAREVLAAAQK